MRASGSPPGRADGLQNRARLLAVARADVEAGGPLLGMHELARKAGLGVGTVYRHFPDRRALLEALSVERLERLVANVREAARDTDPVSSLRRSVSAALEATTDPTFAAVLSSGDVRPDMAGLMSELQQLIEEVLERARTSGYVRADLNADDLRRLVCGVQHAARSGPSEPDRAGLYLEVLLAGLCTGPEDPARGSASGPVRHDDARRR